ncbi:cytochrome d ubiquinol oxidase subunit II [Coraliomargarita parva]|uniref:cytochrome d ubiquinol oxidase subunit II n=1 Tax=Coraliomargarita parva TaxID=3014050 RepID=UPI0022B3C177|nr:cytochrome d ubiquinol oxidase subunit II [Coraliomargarita parva]
MSGEIFSNGDWLPFVFAFLIGLSMLLYAVLDGYDLGVGLLSRFVERDEREKMIASIGPFWDANETWLVLGVGLLLVAFPAAHGVILTHLYLPAALMIISLVYRGVSFDFRKKVAPEKQGFWNKSFFLGSLMMALSQGYMLGRYMIGFQEGVSSQLFAMSFGVLVVAGYVLMGACWLIMKCENALQKKAIRWARYAIWVMVLGAILSSLSAPFVDTRIYDRMFAFPEITLLIVMPLISVVLTLLMHFILGILPLEKDRLAWMPFAIAICIFVLGFIGLVYSFYPYIIPGHLKIVDASAAPESLMVMLIGTGIVLPFLLLYTALAYWIFRGKASHLSYD